MNERLYIASEVAPDDTSIQVLGRVSVRRDIDVNGQGRIGAGSRGTIVAVYDKGAAYCVEFTQPFQAEIDLASEDLEAVAGESRADIIAAARVASR